jgi:hypothetical protein
MSRHLPIRPASVTAMLATAALAVTSCSPDMPQLSLPSRDGPAFTGPAPTLTADQAIYIAVGDSVMSRERQYRFTVIATLQNNGDQTLYLSTCGSESPVYEIESANESAYSPIWACSGDAGTPLPGHSMRVDTLHVVGPSSFDGHTGKGFGSLSGTITLTYELGTCTEASACRNGSIAAASDPFTVTALP